MKTLHNNDGQEIVTMLSRDGGGGERDILPSCRGGGGSKKSLVKLQISTET